jgi:ABC-type transporter Mla maintaining outer membrane lipid asymmetry ATPase subunit MlaF
VRTLNLGIERGECFGLLGPNGAGKSTSINMMVGLLEPSEGTAIIGGYDITQVGTGGAYFFLGGGGVFVCLFWGDRGRRCDPQRVELPVREG